MKYYGRLILATALAVVLVFLLALAVYWLRGALDAAGYHVSDRVFLVFLFGALGGGFGLASKLVLRAANRDREINQSQDGP